MFKMSTIFRNRIASYILFSDVLLRLPACAVDLQLIQPTELSQNFSHSKISMRNNNCRECAFSKKS